MYEVLFVIEFALLFFLAKSLISSLSNLFFKLTKSKKMTVMLLAFLFFPGTVVHELAHLFVAGLLFVRTGDMELVPKIIGNEVKLGSVGIEKTDLFRRAIIGIAPVLVGMMVIFGTLFYLQSNSINNLIVYFISVYVIFVVGNTLFSSKKDLEGTIELIVAVLFIIVALFVVRQDFRSAALSFWQTKEIAIFFKNSDLFLIAPILIDFVVIFVIRFAV